MTRTTRSPTCWEALVLSEERIRALFSEYLPRPEISVLVLDAATFTGQALAHPYVKLQIQMGVYNEDNIRTDFLSPARVHTELDLQIICVEIFDHILEGIPDEIAENYVRHVAAHEAHHFHAEHEPVSAADHSASELVCAQEILTRHPELNEAVTYVEQNSPVYRRVFARLDSIKNDFQKGMVR